MRPLVVIDPALFAVANVASDTDEAEQLIRIIIEWTKHLDANSPVQILQHTSTMDLLVAANFFPVFTEIRALLEMFDLKDVFTTEDICRRINSFLQRSQTFLNAAGAEVTAFAECMTDPDILAGYEQKLKVGAQLCLSSVALVAPNLDGLIFARLAVGSSSTETIHVDCKGARLCSISRETQTVDISHKANLIRRYEDILSSVAGENVWRHARCAEDYRWAIRFKALSILRLDNAKASLEAVPDFSLGAKFVESVLQNGGGPNGHAADVICEVCARLICGKPKNVIKDLLGDNGDVRTRNGAIAQRTRITDAHEGLRLMFWRLQSGLIELANVGPKKELKIL